MPRISAAQGWLPVNGATANWTPALVNPRQVSIQHFEKAGRRVDVFIGIFSGQSWTSKLVSSVNQFAAEGNGWSLVDRGTTTTRYSGQPLEVKTGVMLGRDERIVAWQWYWIDGMVTGMDVAAKRQQLRTRLAGKGDTAAWVAIYTLGKDAPSTSTKTLDEFVNEMGAAMDQALQKFAQVDP